MTDTAPAKKPASKRAKAPRAAAKTAPAATDLPGATKGPLKLKGFADLVAEASGANRKVARQVVEAALKLLQERLQKDEVLILPPLGRLRVVKDEAGVRTIKLRAAAPGNSAKEPLAGDQD